MRKLIISISLLGVAACSEGSTSPDVSLVSTQALYTLAPESPPPPPLDSGAYSQGEYGNSGQINMTYFLNKPGTSGWLTFQKNQLATTRVENNARISYSNGTFSGRGSLTYAVTSGSVTLDLSSVSQSSTFGNSDNGYFRLSFARGYYTSPSGGRTALTRASSFGLSKPEVCVGDRACGGGEVTPGPDA